MTYGSGVRADENSARDGQETSGETVYSEAGETPVPALSHPAFGAVDVRAALDRAAAAGDWLKVAALAYLLDDLEEA